MELIAQILFLCSCSNFTAKSKEEPVDDEQAFLRKMRRLTDYYDIQKEIGRWSKLFMSWNKTYSCNAICLLVSVI